MRFPVLIALGLVLAAALGAAAKLISNDSAGPLQTPSPHIAEPNSSTPPTTVQRSEATGNTRSRSQVTAPYDHRGREGIEEAEVDSHEDAPPK